MTRGVRLYLVGSFVLVSLAGCGRGFFQSAEREPWRTEAEVACLKSGAVKESPELVRIDPISGPGVCGAEYPLKVAALGENITSFGFADESLRPPANIGNQPRWPIARAPAPAPSQGNYSGNYSGNYPGSHSGSYPDPAPRQPNYAAPSNGPISLSAPGVAPQQDDIDLPPEGVPTSRGGGYAAQPSYPPRDRYTAPPSPPYAQPSYSPSPAAPRLGPAQGNSVSAFGQVSMKPPATLACPIVSALDRWLTDSVQPAAMRWFGVRVVEIKQISAYSCRGMNGNPHAHISEHAFGNALDIAAFTLADGRRITVKGGWRGVPEEQGFLRDVQAAACQQFNTVLAPGSNSHHEDHIHVDLMRRPSRRTICQPAAVSGEQVAARAQRNPYASRDPYSTGSLGSKKPWSRWFKGNSKVNEEDAFHDH
ncbi:extensin family protein [Bradyrhizobium icense]|uniref:Extensin n=1 Tax=Bradyrhizobium icense TaxID=1274631 RepID=A0A1B1UMU8_9BRAD|nr:extensin family protein [Bradyrhizobium icense]ANW04028.1 extensin [Bradyrhizobium icense]